MSSDMIETRIDPDHAHLGPLPRQAQRPGRVTGSQIDMNLPELCTPRLAARRGREERELIHRGAFPVRNEKPNAEKAARRSTD